MALSKSNKVNQTDEKKRQQNQHRRKKNSGAHIERNIKPNEIAPIARNKKGRTRQKQNTNTTYDERRESNASRFAGKKFCP